MGSSLIPGPLLWKLQLSVPGQKNQAFQLPADGYALQVSGRVAASRAAKGAVCVIAKQADGGFNPKSAVRAVQVQC